MIFWWATSFWKTSERNTARTKRVLQKMMGKTLEEQRKNDKREQEREMESFSSNLGRFFLEVNNIPIVRLLAGAFQGFPLHFK